jgi:hypothetical protein
MKAHIFHLKEEAMKPAKQCALLLHRKDYEDRIRKGSRPELVRLLAEMLIQVFKSDQSEKEGEPWKK